MTRARRLVRDAGHRARVAVGLAGAVLVVSACAVSGEPQQPGFAELRTLAPGGSITQSFVARVGPLDRFALLVANYDDPDPDATLTLSLRGGGEERTARASGSEIPDAEWLTFRFAPLGDAADEEFEATVTLSGSDPVAYYVNPNDPYPDGALGGTSADLAFRVGHARTLRGAAVAVARTLGEFADRLARDPLFAILWAGVLAGGLVALWWRRPKTSRNGR